MKFSVIIVCLNAGGELKKTVDSVLSQTYGDYEIIVKDGGSEDGSTEFLKDAPKVRLIVKKDRSIYDAMNQACRYAVGDYYYFLNCGDYLADENVLERVARFMKGTNADIFYGDLYRRKLASTDVAPDYISSFVCYRNVPNHQVCFYSKRLFEKKGYDIRFIVRADYEHFLRCMYKYKAVAVHMPFTVADYMGDGFSERDENSRISDREHKIITRKYLGKKCLLYEFIMMITLQPLRKKLANSRKFSALYHRLKGGLYGQGQLSNDAAKRKKGER